MGNQRSMSTCRILIVEDDPAITELISLNLQHAGFQVASAGDASRAQAAVDGTLPNLVVLDWMLPGQSGIALVRHWRRSPRTERLPVVMLSGRSDEADILAGLDAGADDYVVKPFSPIALLARINAVLRRLAPETLDSPVVAGSLSVDPVTRCFRVGGTEVKLGSTEFKLLQFLMTYPDHVHTRKTLLDRVWGDHVFIEERTVDVHVRRLRSSLSQVGCGPMVETVRGAGYRFANVQREGLR